MRFIFSDPDYRYSSGGTCTPYFWFGIWVAAPPLISPERDIELITLFIHHLYKEIYMFWSYRWSIFAQYATESVLFTKFSRVLEAIFERARERIKIPTHHYSMFNHIRHGSLAHSHRESRYPMWRKVHFRTILSGCFADIEAVENAGENYE